MGIQKEGEGRGKEGEGKQKESKKRKFLGSERNWRVCRERPVEGRKCGRRGGRIMEGGAGQKMKSRNLMWIEEGEKR